MKRSRILGVFIIGITLLPLSVDYTAGDTDIQQSDSGYQLQPATIFDNTYMVFIWNGTSTLFHPRYVDQFEFKAGDVFSAYTSKAAELTGKWFETDLGFLTRFQAWVEETEETTTTTSIPTVTSGTLMGGQTTAQPVNYDINLWGFSYVFTPPPPLDLFGFSVIVGSGAYLGADSVFVGFASVPGIGGLPSFGSITPSEGEQGQTFDVTITGVNTTFKQAASITVSLGDDITVGTPGVISDTELRVSITIGDTAETTARTVTVTYDSSVIFKANAFTVLKKTTT